MFSCFWLVLFSSFLYITRPVKPLSTLLGNCKKNQDNFLPHKREVPFFPACKLQPSQIIIFKNNAGSFILYGPQKGTTKKVLDRSYQNSSLPGERKIHYWCKLNMCPANYNVMLKAQFQPDKFDCVVLVHDCEPPVNVNQVQLFSCI